MIYGVDVSAWQGDDIAHLLGGKDFCFVKVSEGQHTVDSGWSGRVGQVRDADLVVGVYHFAHPENDVAAEAAHFVTTYGPALRAGDLIALDWEATGGLDRTANTAWKDAWIARVQAAFPSNLVGLYCNANYWLSQDVSSDCGDFLWIANYSSTPGIQAAWTIWQYTSTPVDTNKAAFGSRAEMAEWARSKDDGQDDNDDAFPGAGHFGPGADNAYVTELGRMLIERGAGAFYSQGPGPAWSDVDGAATAAFQTAQGWSGSDADGIPGAQAWGLLTSGGGHDIADPGGGLLPFPSTRWFEQAPDCWIVTATGQRLVAEGCSCYSSGPGPQWSEADRCSYEKWQRKQGATGSGADGYPGPSTWAALRVPGA